MTTETTTTVRAMLEGVTLYSATIDSEGRLPIPHTGNGYGCGPLERSNLEAVEDDLDGAPAELYSYGWGGDIVVDADAEVPEEYARAVVEILEALESYLCLDEGRMSELEMEDVETGWEDYGRYDLRAEVERIVADADSGATEDVPESVLDSTWWDWCRDHGEGGYVHEGYHGAHFYTVDAAPAVALQLYVLGYLSEIPEASAEMLRADRQWALRRR